MTKAKEIVIAAEEANAPAIHKGLELPACCCGAKMTVGRKTWHDENLGRRYAMYTERGAAKGGFKWPRRMECLPHAWDSGRCGPMKCWFQEEKHMFFCHRNDVGGCGEVHQVNYAPITGHRDYAKYVIVYEDPRHSHH